MHEHPQVLIQQQNLKSAGFDLEVSKQAFYPTPSISVMLAWCRNKSADFVLTLISTKVSFYSSMLILIVSFYDCTCLAVCVSAFLIGIKCLRYPWSGLMYASTIHSRMQFRQQQVTLKILA